MNFQSLQTVEHSNTYIDIAFKKANKKAGLIRSKKFKDKLTKSKQIELVKLITIKDVLVQHLEKIIKSYNDPRIRLIKNKKNYG